ncbi:MAG: hypothetical protein ACREPB_14200 [Arenimonas sp.]
MKLRLWTLASCLVLVLLSAPQVNAQGGANLTPPDLTQSSFPKLDPAPVPVDENGNPISAPEPTAEQLAAQRLEEERRAEQIRAEEEKQLADNMRRAEEEKRAADLLAEQKQFHDRVMWAIYIGLGILALLAGAWLLRKND